MKGGMLASVTRRLVKIAQNFVKVAKRPRNIPKYQSTIWKFKTYIKSFLKLWNTFNKPCFETASLGNSVNKIGKVVAQNMSISFNKITMSLQKKPKLLKISKSGHPVVGIEVSSLPPNLNMINDFSSERNKHWLCQWMSKLVMIY